MTIRFEPRDIWVGPFWDRRPDGLHIYVCPIPCVVIHWIVGKKKVVLPAHRSATFTREASFADPRPPEDGGTGAYAWDFVGGNEAANWAASGAPRIFADGAVHIEEAPRIFTDASDALAPPGDAGGET